MYYLSLILNRPERAFDVGNDSDVIQFHLLHVLDNFSDAIPGVFIRHIGIGFFLTSPGARSLYNTI